MNVGQAHKTRFWYLLGVFSKFFDEQHHHFNFIGEYPQGTVHYIMPKGNPTRLYQNLHVYDSQIVMYD